MMPGIINIDSDRKSAILAFLAVLIVLCVAYRQTIFSIVNVWIHSNTYMHGFLIVPVSIWLIWRNRERLYSTQIARQKYAILPLCIVVIVWLGGKLVDAQIIMHLAFVTLIPLLVWLFFGRNILYELAFPLAYLYFAVPIGASIVPYMQDITAGFTVNALRLTGIPVFWEGHYIYIPTGSFEVAEACSGIRFLIASIALGVLYGYLSYNSLWRRLLFVFLSILIPIIANGIRAYGIIMIAHLSDYKLATGVDHIVYGWIFFSIVLMTMFWAGSYFREDAGLAMKGTTNVVKFSESQNRDQRINIVLPMLAILILMAGPATGYWEKNSKGAAPAYHVTLPAGQNGWEGPFNASISWKPQYGGANQEVVGAYKLNDKKIDVYLAYYYKQNQGAEMINENNSPYSGDWHKILDNIESKDDMSMREISIAAEGKRMLLRQWYLVDGQSVASPILAKIYEARSHLASRYIGSYVVMLGVDANTDSNNPVDMINSFINDMWPVIRDKLLNGYV